MECVKIKEFEFRDNHTRYFYHKSLNTLFLDSSLTIIEKRRIIYALYIRLGILTPPPDNIYVCPRRVDFPMYVIKKLIFSRR